MGQPWNAEMRSEPVQIYFYGKTSRMAEKNKKNPDLKNKSGFIIEIIL